MRLSQKNSISEEIKIINFPVRVKCIFYILTIMLFLLFSLDIMLNNQATKWIFILYLIAYIFTCLPKIFEYYNIINKTPELRQKIYGHPIMNLLYSKELLKPTEDEKKKYPFIVILYQVNNYIFFLTVILVFLYDHIKKYF
jgi:hypothetical protein